MDPPPSRASPTWEVSAASGRTAPHPAALVHGHRPGLQLVGLQGISREVADFQLCEMVDEIVIGHPERLEERDPCWKLGEVRLRDQRGVITTFGGTWACPQGCSCPSSLGSVLMSPPQTTISSSDNSNSCVVSGRAWQQFSSPNGTVCLCTGPQCCAQQKEKQFGEGQTTKRAISRMMSLTNSSPGQNTGIQKSFL